MPYAMSGTEIGCATTRRLEEREVEVEGLSLRARYAMSGTDIGHVIALCDVQRAVEDREESVRYAPTPCHSTILLRMCYAMSVIFLRACCALFGTDIAYATALSPYACAMLNPVLNYYHAVCDVRVSYAATGTDLKYDATGIDLACAATGTFLAYAATKQYRLSGTDRVYAATGTDLAYVPTRQYAMSDMLLPVVT
eukprot:3177848-Rhodomonas_salina.9